MLPVEPQMTALAPLGLALVMAIVMPRSLNEPDGLRPSNLSQTSALESLGQPVGVQQRRVALLERDDVVDARRGRTSSAYSTSSPFQPVTRHPVDDADARAHRVDRRRGAASSSIVAAHVGAERMVGEEGKPRLVAEARLLHRADRNAVASEDARDLGRARPGGRARRC